MSKPRWKLERGADGEIADATSYVVDHDHLSWEHLIEVARLAATEERARTFAEVLTRWREVSESLGEFEKWLVERGEHWKEGNIDE